MNIINLQRCITKHFSKPSNKNISNTSDSTRSSIQVCIFGGHTPLGNITSFLLKQNPIISILKIQGDKMVTNLAQDLNQMDTKCQIEAYPHSKDVSKALSGADIVLLLSNQIWPDEVALVNRILAESRRVYDLARECTLQAPRALIVVAVPPVSVFTPLVANVFKKSNFYHPGRIIGSVAIAQVKINSLVGRYQDLDPYICHLPIVGGPDIDLAVPLFSKAKPVGIDDRSARILMAQFRHVHKDEFPKKHCRQNFIEDHELCEAYALNNMINTLGLGIVGDSKAFYSAFVRTNVIPTCQHLVTTLQFSQGGVVHNLGLPPLSNLELDMLERAVLEIKEREQIAQELVEYCQGNVKTPSFELKEKEKQKALMQSVIK